MEEPPRRVDEPSTLPKILPEGFIDLAPGLAEPSDLKITKKSWGAFSVPELDLRLRERGVRTIALGGVATQFGVEFHRAAGVGARLRAHHRQGRDEQHRA